MFVDKGAIGNKPTLVQVMAWRRTGDNPLPEQMLTQFTAVYSVYAALGGGGGEYKREPMRGEKTTLSMYAMYPS